VGECPITIYHFRFLNSLTITLEEAKRMNKFRLRNTISANEHNFSRKPFLTKENQPFPVNQGNIKSPFKEETKGNKELDQDEMMRKANEITQSYIKRVSEHPKARLRKIWSKGEECKQSVLEFRKRRQLLTNFTLRNIKLVKPYWKELLGLKINPKISFVDYCPEEHSYKVKPAYIAVVQDLITSKFCKIGIADTIIEVPHFYSVSSLSLQNFLINNIYNEEVMNALLMLYQQHASDHGFSIYNTFSYLTVLKRLNQSLKDESFEILYESYSKMNAIIFPIMIDNPY